MNIKDILVNLLDSWVTRKKKDIGMMLFIKEILCMQEKNIWEKHFHLLWVVLHVEIVFKGKLRGVSRFIMEGGGSIVKQKPGEDKGQVKEFP